MTLIRVHRNILQLIFDDNAQKLSELAPEIWTER